MAIYKAAGKVIFFAHVPRCGGTSVESLLRRRFGPPAFLQRKFRKAGAESWTRTSPQHVTVAALSTLFPDGFFDHSFAVVRHPEDRLLSAFTFLRDVEKVVAPDAVFEDFVQKLRRPRFRNRDAFDNHFRQQVELVPENAVVFRLEDGLEQVIGHIDALAGTVLGSAGVPHRLANSGTKPPVSDAARSAIEEIYAPDYDRFGFDRRAPATAAAAGPAAAGPDRADGLRISLKTSVLAPRNKESWGDYHFAKSLARALESRGHETRIDCVPEWDRDPDFAQANIELRGLRNCPRRGDAPHVSWVIYPGVHARSAATIKDHATEVDYAFFASEKAHQSFADAHPGRANSGFLPQCFDPEIMCPGAVDGRSGVIFVGTNHARKEGLRPIVAMAVEAGLPLELYGPGFERSPAESFLRGGYVANAELGEKYRGALAVLCDHRGLMRELGFVSNRVFDALACGTPVICDKLEGLPPEFLPHVFCCETPDDITAAFEAISAETDAERSARVEYAREMVREHSFQARARRLEAAIYEIMAQARAGGQTSGRLS